MTERAEKGESIIISDKVAEFAADIMTMLSFTEPWGFVHNSRDERHMLHSWREGLDFFGFVGRFRWFRDVVMKTRWGLYFLPSVSDDDGMGFLMSQADKHVTDREKRIENEGFTQEKPDFLQYCLTARNPTTNAPLTPSQKRAHITLLIQAGADTTGTALGSTLRFLLTHPSCLARCRAEIASASARHLLSDPIQFDQTRAHLPFFVACIKESLRLNPPATNLFARTAPRDGGGGSLPGAPLGVPAGAEVTSNAYVVQRDPRMYGPDPESFRPGRWLVEEGDDGEGARRVAEMEAASFVFGVGPRVCLGKDVAVLEMWKLLPEIVRQFDLELVKEGRIAGMSIASQLPKGHEVTIVARDLPGDPDSFTWTSPWAGAIWLGMDDSPPREQKMQLEAFAHMWKLAMAHPESSVKRIEIHDLLDFKKPEDMWYHGKMPGFRVMSKDELPEGVAHGISYHSWVLTPPVFLPWLRSQLEGAGVTFKRVNVRSLADLSGMGHDILINATGWGARFLSDVADENVEQVRGQTVLVKTDYDKIWTRRGKDYTYVIPRGDGTAVLGGIKQFGNT
ncbi:D-amino-acid oxidase [Lasiodiplodia theobromae]|uniref:D-amino-acid oxidase n=1 Tax=Lasiodiplodia theobromae TaxID=45133 RepID=A0A5N5DDF9_9PEZI|nr:D-amino-acid oxidase [Lasiodiplodia theobromae]